MSAIRTAIFAIPPVVLLLTGAAAADPTTCQKQVIKGLQKVKKARLVRMVKCVDAENVAKIPGPCPDAVAQAKILTAFIKVQDKLNVSCLPADVAALGFTDCNLAASSGSAEAACAALPVTTGAELATCLACWKEAELSEYLAILYASHAVAICDGDVSGASTTCDELDCTTPLPIQRDLGDSGENDCQRSIAKAGYKYVLAREKTLEKCGLAGGTQATCLADPEIQLALAKAITKKDALIAKKCGNRAPDPDPPFCCRTGQGNECSVASTRDDCENLLSGTVQEGKTCTGGTCDPTPGGQTVTWWGYCPESTTCPGTPLTTLDDVRACVESSADTITASLLCLQFRGNGGADWPCPPDSASPAFLDQ